jgi:DNA end-binding protein Ku
MARPIWSGTISFGLVTVPVELYSATEDHTVSFRQLERDTDDRVRNRRVNERTGKEVDYADIVKGYEVRRGEYVPVEPEELAEIAPGRSRSIEIESFVDLHDIDPMFFNRAYWLAPAGSEYAHAYYLLLRALAETDRVGIAMFVLRGKQHLTAVRAGERVLTLETLFFADEIRDPAKEIDDLPHQAKPKSNELGMAVDLIESMTAEWRPSDYRDTYRDRVEKLLQDKAAGREIEVEDEPAEPTGVIDLTDALRRSMESRRKAKSTRSAKSGKSGKTAKRGRAATTSLDGLTKAELDKKARELGVKGRSTMTRPQLAKAVAQAQSPRKAS